MRIYLSAPFSRGKSLRHLQAALRDKGYEVECRWLGVHVDKGQTATPKERAAFAEEDLADVRNSDVVVTFTMPRRR